MYSSAYYALHRCIEQEYIDLLIDNHSQVPVVSTPMPLMQPMIRPAMALAPSPQFTHVMRPGHPAMGIPPGMYSHIQK